ncbi:MAG TPA: NAD(P)-dependent oxidoreductase [Pyrinomonadaceae bacterium]|nr:NAD(P)-dependent oxidoreductase [Pyrinomonadaceae bacterium]
MQSRHESKPVVLVTGASGLLGSRVVSCLSQNIPDCRLLLVTRNNKNVHENDNTEVVTGDLRDEQLWTSLPDTITHVVHLASVIPRQVEERYQPTMLMDNLLPLTHLLEQSRNWSHLAQVIYSSSVSVYTQSDDFLNEESTKQPADLYGASKLAGEELLNSFAARNVATASLRLSSLYAHGQYQGTVLPLMINRALQQQPLLLFGEGSRTQDFLHCDDAARAILLSFQKRANGVYNVGTGVPVTMADLARTVSHVFTGDTAEIVFQHDQPDKDSGLKLDISKARRELNFRPEIDLASGLRKLKQEMNA